ncbi:ATP-binding cassette domain-containing protein [Haloplanus rubicundus]|uniref:Cobalamin import ATP-binding protein BtuD n=1 Tax=Haloplanus rubicundus TaxID=1547898 RepID=A0A345EDC4_9EURY|nr:ATP-binding cassette domain-containing protein [Haloplanus rubicundus]AXG06822.1 ATP-binding cassette domain-containing protein [Haloplanus rubicundus]AXG10196.1 ATP-binding cassette domain-containing protein [Haloplanus rubicundus]
MTPAIDVDGVSVSLGGVTVLDAVSTSVDEGQFVGLVGPNGTGKTTLLRTINGALAPDRGAVHVAGEDVAALGSRATSQLVATVPQSTAIAFEFPVRHVVAMGRTPHIGRFGTRTTADREAVDAAMERAAIANLADRPVTEVSGGERQRVFLARALAQDTPVLLLDEPTSDLDVNHQVRTLDIVSELVAEGRTVVAAIHDLDLAARYCDELRLLYDGRVQAAGPPASVLTGATVEAAFGARATVTDHPVTGSVSVTAFVDDPDAADGRVHVVGGGGAATPLLHRLDAAGFECSVGAVSADDPDAETARAIDADLVTVPPYAPVDDEARGGVVDRLRRADAVVVADVTVAPGNRPVLDAVRGADAPVVVVDGRPIDERNFAGAAGRRLDARLRTRGRVVDDDPAAVVAAVRRVVGRGTTDTDPDSRTAETDPRP